MSIISSYNLLLALHRFNLQCIAINKLFGLLHHFKLIVDSIGQHYAVKVLRLPFLLVTVVAIGYNWIRQIPNNCHKYNFIVCISIATIADKWTASQIEMRNARALKPRRGWGERRRQSCWMNDWRTKVWQNNILLNLIIAMKIGQWQQLIVCFATWKPSKTYTSTHEINPRTRINVKLTLPNGKFFSLSPVERDWMAIFCVVERHLSNSKWGCNAKCYDIYSIWKLGPEMIEHPPKNCTEKMLSKW